MTTTSPTSTAARPGHDVLLADGTTARLCPVVPSDEPALLALDVRASLLPPGLRWSTAREAPDRSHVHHVVQSAPGGHALRAEVNGEVVALGSFSRLERDPSVADLEILVDEDHRETGLVAELVQHLARIAGAQQVTRLTAPVLLENADMRRVLSDAGCTTTALAPRGLVELGLDLHPSPSGAGADSAT